MNTLVQAAGETQAPSTEPTTQAAAYLWSRDFTIRKIKKFDLTNN